MSKKHSLDFRESYKKASFIAALSVKCTECGSQTCDCDSGLLRAVLRAVAHRRQCHTVGHRLGQGKTCDCMPKCVECKDLQSQKWDGKKWKLSRIGWDWLQSAERVMGHGKEFPNGEGEE